MIFIVDIHHVSQNEMLQELAGTLLFMIVIIWAAYKLLPKKEEEDDDDDRYLGI